MATDPLSNLPQIPVDWANHICQGGLGSIVISVLANLVRFNGSHAAADIQSSVFYGLVVMAIVAAAKKTFDYFNEGESVAVCVGKTIATIVWPASLFGLTTLLV